MYINTKVSKFVLQCNVKITYMYEVCIAMSLCLYKEIYMKFVCVRGRERERETVNKTSMFISLGKMPFIILYRQLS